MARLNGLQYSKYNQIAGSILGVLFLAAAIFFLTKSAWMPALVASALFVLACVIVYFARKPEGPSR